MMIKKLKLNLAAITVIAFSNTATSEETYAPDYLFGDWGAYRDGKDCWIVTHPEFEDGTPWEDTFLYVTFHNLVPTPSISIWPTVPVNEEFGVIVHLGDASQKFTFANEVAFPDRGEDIPILKSMISSENLSFDISTTENGIVASSVSYDGFLEAYNYLSKACDFRNHGDFRIDEWMDLT